MTMWCERPSHRCDFCNRFKKQETVNIINFIPDSDISSESYDQICDECEEKQMQYSPKHRELNDK